MITENEAKNWYNRYLKKCRINEVICEIEKEFIIVGKEKGYIELSAIDEAREYFEKIRESYSAHKIEHIDISLLNKK